MAGEGRSIVIFQAQHWPKSHVNGNVPWSCVLVTEEQIPNTLKLTLSPLLEGSKNPPYFLKTAQNSLHLELGACW